MTLDSVWPVSGQITASHLISPLELCIFKLALRPSMSTINIQIALPSALALEVAMAHGTWHMAHEHNLTSYSLALPHYLTSHTANHDMTKQMHT